MMIVTVNIIWHGARGLWRRQHQKLEIFVRGEERRKGNSMSKLRVLCGRASDEACGAHGVWEARRLESMPV